MPAYTIVSAMAWPEALRCRERAVSWVKDFQTEFSPVTLAGTRQGRDSTGGGLVRAAWSGVQLRSPAQVRAWIALDTALRGGKTPINVPYLLRRYQPKAAGGPDVLITSVGGWAARDMEGRVDLENAVSLEAGMVFSDYDPTTYGHRLHFIDSVAAVSGQPTQRDITFWPPARFAVADNHELEFDGPLCTMQQAASDVMDLTLELRKRGEPNAEFVECG